MTYGQITTAIERITSSDDCTTNQKQQLFAVNEDVLKMSPDIKASSKVVTKFMQIAGCLPLY